MAISFVGESHGPGFGNGVIYANSVQVNVPAGVQDGDLLIAFIGGTRSGSVPSGWTQLLTGSQGTTTGTVYVYYRFADASEPSSYTFTFNTTRWSCTTNIVAYRGVDQADPFGSANMRDRSSTSSFNTNSITVTADQWVVSFASQYTYGNGEDEHWTANVGTERIDDAESGGSEDASSCWYDSNGTVSAGSYSVTHTLSNSASVGCTGLAALNPALSTIPATFEAVAPFATVEFDADVINSADIELAAPLPTFEGEGFILPGKLSLTAPLPGVEVNGDLEVAGTGIGSAPVARMSLRGLHDVLGPLAIVAPFPSFLSSVETRYTRRRRVVVIKPNPRTLKVTR